MADPVVWAPIPGWPAAYVPKTFHGVREWDADGPKPAPGTPLRNPLGLVYEFHGQRLYCVNCPDSGGSAGVVSRAPAADHLDTRNRSSQPTDAAYAER